MQARSGTNNVFNVEGLATLFAETEPVSGVDCKMFKVDTDKGIYCVKVLNPEVMSRSDAYDNFVESEKISHFMKDNGINVSCAIEFDGNYLVKMDDMYFMVFDFVFGKTLKDDEITVDHCKKIGNILGHIHLLDYKKIGLEIEKVNIYEDIFNFLQKY